MDDERRTLLFEALDAELDAIGATADARALAYAIAREVDLAPVDDEAAAAVKH